MMDAEFTPLRKKLQPIRSVKDGTTAAIKGICAAILEGENAAEMRKIANAGLKNAELISTAVLTNTPIAQEGVGSEGTRSAGG